MRIREVAQRSGFSSKTIRYYEEVGLLPSPSRSENNYRWYDQRDVERLRLVAGARKLDLSHDDIREILALRNNHASPCGVLLERIAQKADGIAGHIQTLRQLERELRDLHTLGLTFSTSDLEENHRVCRLVSEKQVDDSPHREELP